MQLIDFDIQGFEQLARTVIIDSMRIVLDGDPDDPNARDREIAWMRRDGFQEGGWWCDMAGIPHDKLIAFSNDPKLPDSKDLQFVADIVERDIRTLRYACEASDIPAFPDFNGYWRILTTDLQEVVSFFRNRQNNYWLYDKSEANESIDDWLFGLESLDELEELDDDWEASVVAVF